MIYRLFDKFLVRGILCEVRVVNNGMAWICPLEDTPAGAGRTHLSCVTLDVLDEKGFDRQGNKAKVVSNIECGAV